MKKIFLFLSSLVIILLFSNKSVFAADVYQGYSAASNWQTVNNYITDYLESLPNPIAKKDYTKQIRFGYYTKEDSGLESYRERVYILPAGLDTFDELFLVPVRTDRIIYLKLLAKSGTRYFDLSTTSNGNVAYYTFRQFINPTGSIRDDIHDTGIIESASANIGLLGDSYLMPQTFNDVLTVLVDYMGEYTWVKTVFQNGENIIDALSNGNYEIYDNFPSYDESIPTVENAYVTYRNNLQDSNVNTQYGVSDLGFDIELNYSFPSDLDSSYSADVQYSVSFTPYWSMNPFKFNDKDLKNPIFKTDLQKWDKASVIWNGNGNKKFSAVKDFDNAENKSILNIAFEDIEKTSEWLDYYNSQSASNKLLYSIKPQFYTIDFYIRIKKGNSYGDIVHININESNMSSTPVYGGNSDYSGTVDIYSGDTNIQDITDGTANPIGSYQIGTNVNIDTKTDVQTFQQYLGEFPKLLASIITWIPTAFWTLFLTAFTIICAVGIVKAML